MSMCHKSLYAVAGGSGVVFRRIALMEAVSPGSSLGFRSKVETEKLPSPRDCRFFKSLSGLRKPMDWDKSSLFMRILDLEAGCTFSFGLSLGSAASVGGAVLLFGVRSGCVGRSSGDSSSSSGSSVMYLSL